MLINAFIGNGHNTDVKCYPAVSCSELQAVTHRNSDSLELLQWLSHSAQRPKYGRCTAEAPSRCPWTKEKLDEEAADCVVVYSKLLISLLPLALELSSHAVACFIKATLRFNKYLSNSQHTTEL